MISFFLFFLFSHTFFKDKVELCRQAENDFLGLKNGLLDQTTILFSRPSHLTCIDCQKGVGTTPTLVRWGGDNKKDERLFFLSIFLSLMSFLPSFLLPSFSRISFGVMVVYCGKSRVLANTNYNNRVGECREAASLLLQTKEEKKLREVSPSILFSFISTHSFISNPGPS